MMSQTTNADNRNGGGLLYHALALIVVGIWGTTFVSTKALLNAGLSPTEIMLYRFALAYVGILACSRPLKLVADTARDEVLCFMTGLLGSTLYFYTENTALKYTYVTNVSLICSITPLLTMLIGRLILKQGKLSRANAIGSVLAFAGVGVVIFNGQIAFNLNPIGDALCLASALSWTLYTLISKQLSTRYRSIFIVRKTFFYGIVTLVPILIAEDKLHINTELLSLSTVWSQLLFLGLVGSLLCFITWNICLKRLDTVVVSNYIYLIPVISITASSLILGEAINAIAIGGAALVIVGMYFADQKGRD